MLSQSVKQCLSQNHQNSTQLTRMKPAEASSVNSTSSSVCSVLRYTEATARNPMTDPSHTSVNLSQFPFQCTVYSSPQSPSHSIQMNVGSDNHAIIFASNKCFRLDDTYQRGLERNKTVGTDENAINHSQDLFPCAQYNKWFEIRHPLIHDGSSGEHSLYMTSKVL